MGIICQMWNTSKEETMDLSNARAAIEQNGAKLGAALTARDYRAAAALYAEDAQLLPPDAPIITGRSAIKAFWSEAVPALGVQSATFKTLDVTLSGDQAVEVGTVHIVTAGGPVTVKFLVTWKRGTDGVWQIHRDMWNGMPG
jgi:ketosteroid isomerase-like protein